MSDLHDVDEIVIDLCASWIMGLGVKGGQPEQSKHLCQFEDLAVCLPFYQNRY